MRLEVVRFIGEGGMGRVYLGLRHLGDGVIQRVVIKRPLDNDEARARLREECRVLARIQHANVVGLLDAGRDTEGPFLVMEYVEGADVNALLAGCQADRSLSPDEAAWITHEACRGLCAAHGSRSAEGEPTELVHRDVSPQNLLVSCEGEVKLTDFGVAWALGRENRTVTGAVVGNLRYISPEQLEGRPVGPATDVFGLGRVLEELLAVTPAAPEALRSVAARATQRSMEQRFSGPAAMLDALLDAAPSLYRGRASLGLHVTELRRAREALHDALSAMLSLSKNNPPGALRSGEHRSNPGQADLAPAAPAKVSAVLDSPSRPQRSTLGLIATLTLTAMVAAAVSRRPVAEGTQGALPTTTPSETPRAPTHRPVTESVPVSMALPPPEAPQRVEAPEVPQPAALSPQGREPRRVTVHAPRTQDAGASSRPTATLWVNALPWAEVSVDAQPEVHTPHIFVLAPGEHTVRARFSTGSVRTETVHLSAGQERRLGLQAQ